MNRLVASVAAVASSSLLAAGCSGGGAHAHRAAATTTSTTLSAAEAAGENLLPLIIQAPEGYVENTTAGATGAVSPQVFTANGGSGTASQAGYAAGYKEEYVSQVAPDGIVVTLFKFANAADATSYFDRTAPHTLSFAQPTITSFSLIPGAISVVGTKAYDGDWQSGIVFATKQYYASVFYIQPGQGPAPLELKQWAKAQWLLLNGQ